VKSVVDIARGLGKRTIAEFVGDQESLELLKRYGVDYAQGFYLAKPQALDSLDLAAMPA
jgi:EAL domain-containing protein (putative c-di-GMP-specific phosphodiesterase class I)